MTRHVTVELTDAQAEVLDSEAAREDRPIEAIVAGLIQRQVDYDAWFRAEVQKGVDEADRGELIPHEEVLERGLRLQAELVAKARNR
jgi:predicted transcriptional regulator